MKPVQKAVHLVQKGLTKIDTFDKLFIVLLAFYAFFAYGRIGKASINNDAQFWYTRTQNFIDAVQERRWEETLQNPKPGITVHWLSGLSLEAFLTLYEKIYHFRPHIYTYETFPLVHLAAVGPLITITVLFLIVFYVLGTKLFGKPAALTAAVLYSLQPFYIGISRSFHADSTVTAFMGMSALVLMYYLHNPRAERKLAFVIGSGILGGLAILSKSAAVYLIPFTALALCIDFAFERDKLAGVVKHTAIFSIWLFATTATFFILLPDMWIEPIQNFKEIFLYEGVYLATTGRDGVNNLLYYTEPLVRIVSPIFLVILGLGLFRNIAGFRSFSQTYKKDILLVGCFVLFYMAQMTLAKQKMERYLLPALPFMALLGTTGIFEVYRTAPESSSKSKTKAKSTGKTYTKETNTVIFASVVLATSLLFVLYYYPNYLLQPSEKGKDQFGCSLCSDIGEYLNSKPNAADLKIVTLSEKTHRLKPFVKGKVYTKNEVLPNGWSAEYVIGTVYEMLPEGYSHCDLEKTISFKNTDYWAIYSCK